MFLATEIIDFAIQIERNGENLCRAAAARKMDPLLASLLQWMADQEAQHIQWFGDLKQKTRISCNTGQLELLSKALLRDVLGEQSFSLQDADFSDMRNVQELLRVLMEFEKDTILFYEMLSTAVEDEATDTLLDKIIAEENRHIIRIEDYFQKRFGAVA